jgi:hypothetical protein
VNQATKRIPSAIPIYLSAVVWVLGGLALPLYMIQYILLCAGVSVAAYLVGQRFFPGREVQVEERLTTGDAELDRQIEQGMKDLKALREANEGIASPAVSAKLDRMVTAGEKIFEAIARDKRKATEVQRFMNYYLPTTVKLMSHHRALSNAAGGEQVAGTIQSIERSLDMIAAAFEKQLDNLFRGEALDITTDIQVLETMLAGEGLTAGKADLRSTKNS